MEMQAAITALADIANYAANVDGVDIVPLRRHAGPLRWFALWNMPSIDQTADRAFGRGYGRHL
jgi:hypothetical protein